MDGPKGVNDAIYEIPMEEPWTYKRTDGWEDLHCPHTETVGPFLIKTTCRTPDGKSEFHKGDPSLYKVFVKLPRRQLRNMYDYARLLQLRTIKYEEHSLLMHYLEKQRMQLARKSGNKSVICFNHNMDVGVLHFKYRCANSYKCETRTNALPTN
jgi:hypothetical protein